MATVTDPRSPAQTGAGAAENQLRVSRYDQVSGMLVALLYLVGLAVLLMFIVWLTKRLTFSKTPIPVELLEYAGRGDHAEGLARDEEIGLEELEEMYEPQIEASLEAVTDVVSTQAAAFDAIESAAASSSTGTGLGDSRGPGPLGEGRSDVVPPWDRWEIRFTTEGLPAYAGQLDYFKIELGAAGGAPLLDYAFNLTKPKPDTRKGESEDEKRLYMSWKGGGVLADFDKELLRRAGIKTQRRLVLQFYPKATEQLLQNAEFQAAAEKRGTTPQELDKRILLKTIFGVRTAGRGYEFYVIDQFFRPAPPS
jgi:hypothetical protein